MIDYLLILVRNSSVENKKKIESKIQLFGIFESLKCGGAFLMNFQRAVDK